MKHGDVGVTVMLHLVVLIVAQSNALLKQFRMCSCAYKIY
jgi:hypothetical protein